ncbi:FxsA family protein [Myxococcota bacterium]|nr:FxsA family protein [Myxococcota bacterium]
MFARLFLLFTLVPALEIYFLVLVGGKIGAGPTLGLVLLTGFTGAALARREFGRAWGRLQGSLSRGIPPGQEIVEGLLVVVGGILLLTPGFLTDVAGLACLFPPTRHALGALAVRWAARRAAAGALTVRIGGISVGQPRGTGGDGPADPDRTGFERGGSFGGTWDAGEGKIRPRDDQG